MAPPWEKTQRFQVGDRVAITNPMRKRKKRGTVIKVYHHYIDCVAYIVQHTSKDKSEFVYADKDLEPR